MGVLKERNGRYVGQTIGSKGKGEGEDNMYA